MVFQENTINNSETYYLGIVGSLYFLKENYYTFPSLYVYVCVFHPRLYHVCENKKTGQNHLSKNQYADVFNLESVLLG